MQSEVFCMKIMRWLWIGLLVLCLTLLARAGNHESRWYLEGLSRKELSRIYPTKNIEDLFEVFPNGFSVSQMRLVGDTMVFVYLEANEKGKPFVGTIEQVTKLRAVKKSMTFQYVDGKFIFENEEEVKELWPQGKFLFQELQLNQSVLSNAKLQKKQYWKKEESVSGHNTFYLAYNVHLPELSRILGKDESLPLEFSILGYDESQNKLYEISVEEDGKTIFYENIRGKEN